MSIKINGSQWVMKTEMGIVPAMKQLRGIDMAMEESLNLQCGDYVPHGIAKKTGRCTGSMYSLDINMETLNGLGTIHHTYGIVYQTYLKVMIVAVV